jgi:hypothetical protein
MHQRYCRRDWFSAYVGHGSSLVSIGLSFGQPLAPGEPRSSGLPSAVRCGLSIPSSTFIEPVASVDLHSPSPTT